MLAEVWNTLTEMEEEAPVAATYLVMDTIIKNKGAKLAFESAMLGSSASAAVRAQSLNTRKANNIGKQVGGAIHTAYSLPAATGLVDVSLITDAAVAYTLGKLSPYLQDIWEKTLVLPNIEGVPISTSVMNTTREVEIGEQVMIVQSTTQKQYWTDNAVPKLKEWTLEGYITPALTLDQQYLIKPSLKMQINFLDTCAKSRRPVLFKDNRGEFMFVQITNLQTTEEASYNNAIKVNISLREYKPFEVDNIATSTLNIASRGN